MKKALSIICVILSVVIIVLGVSLIKTAPAHFSTADNSYKLSPNSYDVKGAAFGADFYTYVYGANDTIVDELNEINGAMETVVKGENAIITNTAVTASAVAALIGAVNKVGGTVVLAIGLSALVLSLRFVAEAFPMEKKAAAVQQPEPIAAAAVPSNEDTYFDEDAPTVQVEDEEPTSEETTV